MRFSLLSTLVCTITIPEQSTIILSYTDAKYGGIIEEELAIQKLSTRRGNFQKKSPRKKYMYIYLANATRLLFHARSIVVRSVLVLLQELGNCFFSKSSAYITYPFFQC
jgi:hypothetical protein